MKCKMYGESTALLHAFLTSAGMFTFSLTLKPLYPHAECALFFFMHATVYIWIC